MTAKLKKVYLLVFTGQGDTIGKLVDEDAWNWLQNSQLPIPDSMITDYIAEFKEFDHTLCYEKAKTEIEAAKDDRFNDKALCIAPSRFKNHKTYYNVCHTTMHLIKFLDKHGLILEHEWSGYDL
jgi:hypothetical protein